MLYMIRIQADAAAAPGIEAGFELAGDEDVVCWQDAETGAAQFACYHTAQSEAVQRADALRAALAGWAPDGGWTVGVEALPDAAWQEAWKHFFRAERVSPNVFVHPPWEPGDPSVRCVVEINPGLSFGTGRHFTTRSCLQALDVVGADLPGAALVDAGCGSGILAIAAAKLGYTRVTAFDNDPQAVQSARENAAQNGVAERVALHAAGVENFSAGHRFDVVVANLFDTVLRQCAPAIAGLAVPGAGARLVLSGMLRGQAAAVEEVYRGLGWVEAQRWADHEWTTLLLKRARRRGPTAPQRPGHLEGGRPGPPQP